MSWPLVELGTVAVVSWGNTSITKESYRSSGFPAFSAAGEDGFLEIHENDCDGIVLSAIGARCGRCFKASGKWTAIKNTITILEREQGVVCLQYLFHFLSRANVWPNRGGAQPFIALGDARKVKVPLPPLPEQKRIAAILDKADAIRRKRQQAIQLADNFLRAVFLDMFGDPVTNPKGWPRAALPDVAEKFTDGPFGSNLKSSHYVEDGVRVIRLQNIGVGSLLDDDLAFISEEHYQSLPRNHCQPGDVIVGTLGDPNLRACIIPEGLSSALNKADCLLFRPSEDKVLAEYICWLLNNPSLVESAAGLVRGQTRGRISLGRLKELEIPIPPLSEQERFRSVVRKLLDVQVKINSSCGGFIDAFSSLSQKAFSGEL